MHYNRANYPGGNEDDDRFHLKRYRWEIMIMKNGWITKIVTIILVVSFCVPIGAQAATPETAEPRASAYLADYTAYVCAMGGGDLEIWWEVTGTRTLADVGVLSVSLYESTDNANFYWVRAYSFTNYPNMLWHNDFMCVDHVDYEGVPGRYYKAYVHVWAGPEDGGDGRYIWTPTERCL